MDVSDIITELDEFGFDDTPTAIKVNVINETYWDVCGAEPWPFLEKTVTLTFDGSSGVPANLSGMSPTLTDLHAVLSVRNIGGGPNLEWLDFDAFQEMRPTTLVSGTPRYFYFESGLLTAYPIPAATDTFQLSYIATPDALDENSTEADILLPKQYHRGVLVNGAVAKLYAQEEDTDIAAAFEAFHDKAAARMREFLWKRQYQRNMVIVPADYDDLGHQDC